MAKNKQPETPPEPPADPTPPDAETVPGLVELPPEAPPAPAQPPEGMVEIDPVKGSDGRLWKAFAPAPTEAKVIDPADTGLVHMLRVAQRLYRCKHPVIGQALIAAGSATEAVGRFLVDRPDVDRSKAKTELLKP